METFKIRRLDAVMRTVSALLMASVLVYIVLLFIPTTTFADHAGAGDCPHTHVDAANSFCDEGVAGNRRCGDDKKAICQEVPEELFGIHITTCLCLEKKDQIPPTTITSMMDATKVGLAFPETFSTMSSELSTSGEMVACLQFQTAILDIFSGKDTLMNLEMRIYHPKFLKDIDWIINNLPALNTNLSSAFGLCSSVGVTLPTLPLSTLIGVLADKKEELIQNRSLLYESSSTF